MRTASLRVCLSAATARRNTFGFEMNNPVVPYQNFPLFWRNLRLYRWGPITQTLPTSAETHVCHFPPFLLARILRRACKQLSAPKNVVVVRDFKRRLHPFWKEKALGKPAGAPRELWLPLGFWGPGRADVAASLGAGKG